MDRVPVLSRLLDAVQWAALALGILMIVAMAVLMNVEITSRTLFGVSTQIADEYAGYFFTAATMACFLPALREGRFLRVEGLVARLPLRIRSVTEICAAIVGAATCAVLASATYDLTAASIAFGTRSLQASQTPLAIPQATMPIGFAILAIASLETGVLRAAQLWRGRVPTDGIDHAVD
jgi:C4-dicarboxylate transporter DctQ subunit